MNLKQIKILVVPMLLGASGLLTVSAVAQTAKDVRKDLKALGTIEAPKDSSAALSEQLKALQLLRKKDDGAASTPGYSTNYEQQNKEVKAQIQAVLSLPDSIITRNRRLFVEIMTQSHFDKDFATRDRIAQKLKTVGVECVFNKDSSVTMPNFVPVSEKKLSGSNPDFCKSTEDDVVWMINNTPSVERCDVALSKFPKKFADLDKEYSTAIANFKNQVVPLVKKMDKIQMSYRDKNGSDFGPLADAEGNVDPWNLITRLKTLADTADKQPDDLRNIRIDLNRMSDKITAYETYSRIRDSIKRDQDSISSCRVSVYNRNKTLTTTAVNPAQYFGSLYEETAEAYELGRRSTHAIQGDK